MMLNDRMAQQLRDRMSELIDEKMLLKKQIKIAVAAIETLKQMSQDLAGYDVAVVALAKIKKIDDTGSSCCNADISCGLEEEYHTQLLCTKCGKECDENS